MLELTRSDKRSCRVKQLGKGLQSKFGSSDSEPGLVWAESESQSHRLHESLFSSRVPTTATFDNCTCCVVRPHAIKEGHVGKIIDRISQQVTRLFAEGV
jgi:nucleoside-diphosphate kinase